MVGRTIKFEPEVLEAFQAKCEANGLTMAQVVRHYAKQFVLADNAIMPELPKVTR